MQSDAFLKSGSNGIKLEILNIKFGRSLTRDELIECLVTFIPNEEVARKVYDTQKEFKFKVRYKDKVVEDLDLASLRTLIIGPPSALSEVPTVIEGEEVLLRSFQIFDPENKGKYLHAIIIQSPTLIIPESYTSSDFIDFQS